MHWFFFFNVTATTEIYTLSLHDALPIWGGSSCAAAAWIAGSWAAPCASRWRRCRSRCRSEEHTSELQSRRDLVCRLLLEKKNKTAKVRMGKGKGAPSHWVAVVKPGQILF